MTSNDHDEAPLAELARLLDAWGGDPARWPPHVRQRMTMLAASGPEARALVAEARALDHLIEQARDAPAVLPAAAADRLTDRIFAAALAMPQVATPKPVLQAADAAPLTPSRPSAEVARLQPRRVRAAVAPPGTRWHAAGLLAASLVAGIVLGGNLNLAPALAEIAEAVGVSTGLDPVSAAWADDLGEEDTP